MELAFVQGQHSIGIPRHVGLQYEYPGTLHSITRPYPGYPGTRVPGDTAYAYPFLVRRGSTAATAATAATACDCALELYHLV
eukprot:2964178-Rhodomonas_salina.1